MSEAELRACGACGGSKERWNEMCGGCGRWVLFAEKDGNRFAAPFVHLSETECGVGWDHRPSDDEVAAARAELAAGMGVDVTLRPVGHTVRFQRPFEARCAEFVAGLRQLSKKTGVHLEGPTRMQATEGSPSDYWTGPDGKIVWGEATWPPPEHVTAAGKVTP